jgi:hypothetical protein
MTANRAASIRARLKQHPETSKQDFNLTLTQYGLERLLYRLSISEHASNFLLKGALLFQLWYGKSHRPTRDADLLGYGPDDVPTLVSVFRSICSITVDDGIVFAPESIAGTPIRKGAGYGGVRIDLRATLNRPSPVTAQFQQMQAPVSQATPQSSLCSRSVSSA